MPALKVITESPIQPRTWQKSIGDYLDEHNIDCKKATPLEGGASAYIWLLDGFVNEGSVSSCIMKYSDTTCKNLPALEVPQERTHCEARAMNSEVVAQACREEPSVQVARVLRQFDKSVIMSWAGNVDLRKAYVNEKSLDARDVGSRLGRWTASMHLAGIDNPEVQGWTNGLVETVKESEVKHLRDVLLEEQDFDHNAIDRAEALFRNTTGVQTLIAFDFRPMNTLLRWNESSDRPEVTVVDWECCEYGDPAWDLRMWVAETLVTESKYGSERGLLDSFLTAYRQQTGSRIVNTTFVCKLAVLIGAIWLHLMPFPGWECYTDDDAAPWRTRAVEFIRAGVKEDLAWLSEAGLKPLLL